MKKNPVFYILIGALLISACSSVPSSPTPESSATPPPETVLSSTPASILETPTLQVTPTATPMQPTTLDFPIHGQGAYPAPQVALIDTQGQPVIELARRGKGIFGQADVSPNGKILALASSAGVFLYNAQTLEQLRYIAIDGGSKLVRFSADGGLVAASTQKSIQVWQAEDGAPLYSLDTELKKAFFDFSPNGATLAVLGKTAVQFLDAKSGTAQQTVSLPEQDGVSHLGLRYLNATSLLVISQRQKGLLTRVDVKQGVAYSIEMEGGYFGWKFSHDRKFFAMPPTFIAKTLPVLDTATGKVLLTLNLPDGFDSFEFSPDARQIAVALKDKVCFWSLPDGKQLTCIQQEKRFYGRMAFFPDEKHLVIFGEGTIWDVTTGQATGQIFNDPSQDVVNNATPLLVIPEVLYLRDGWTNEVSAWSKDGHLLGKLSGFLWYQSYKTIAFAPAGSVIDGAATQNLLILGNQSNPAISYEAQTGQRVDSEQSNYQVVVSADGKVAGVTNYKGLTLIKVGTGSVPDAQILVTLQSGEKITSIALSENGKLLTAAFQLSDSSEIRFWNTQDGTQTAVLTFPGKKEEIEITSLAISPNANTLAVAIGPVFYDPKNKKTEGAAIYDLSQAEKPSKTLSMDQTWNIYPGFVRSLAFSPDGQALAIGGGNEINVYDTATWKKRLLQVKTDTTPDALAFIEAGKALAVAGQDGLLHIWGVSPVNPSEVAAAATPAPTAVETAQALTLQGTPYPIPAEVLGSATTAPVTQLAQWGKGTLDCAVVSPDKKVIAVCSSTGVYLYEAQSLNLIRQLTPAQPVARIVFSPDSALLAGITQAGAIAVWNGGDGSLRYVFQPEAPIYSFFHSPYSPLDFSPDGQTLAILSAPKIIFLEAQSGNVGKNILLTVGEKPQYLRYTSAQSLVVMNYASGNDLQAGLRWVDPTNGALGAQVILPKLKIATFGANQKIVATGSYESDSGGGVVQFFDAQTGSSLGKNISVETAINALEFSPQADKLAASYNKQVCVWTAPEGDLETCLSIGAENTPDHIRFSPDGKMLMASSSTSANIWDTTDWSRLPFRPNKLYYPILALEIVTGTDGTQKPLTVNSHGMKLWNLPALHYRYQAPGAVTSLTYLSDEKLVAAAGPWGIDIWDAATGQTLKQIQDDTRLVRFSENGQIVAAARPDGKIALYAPTDGTLLRTLDGLTQPATVLLFAQNDSLVIASSPAETRLWQVVDGAPLPILDSNPTGLLVVKDGNQSGDEKLNGKILAVEKDLSIRVWDTTTGKNYVKPINALKGSLKDVLVATWQGNSIMVLTKSMLYNFDAQALFRVWQYPLTDDQPTLLTTNYGGTLSLVAQARTATLIDAQGQAMYTYPGQFSAITNNRAGTEVALASGNEVQIWQTAITPAAEINDFSDKDYSTLFYIPDGHKLIATLPNQPVISVDDYMSFKFIDPTNGNVLGDAGSNVQYLAYSADLTIKAYVRSGLYIENENIKNASGKIKPIEAELPASYYGAINLRISADGKYLAGIPFSGTGTNVMLAIWDTSNGKLISQPTIPGSNLGRLAFSPDGKTIALKNKDTVLIYDIQNPKTPLLKQTLPVADESLVFSPDGKYLVVGGNSKVTFLEVEKQWQPAFSFETHQGDLLDLLFTPDGKTLITAGKDGTLRLWGLAK